MNQLYRALHMPPARLIKKLSGQKEIYTIAVRRRPTEPGAEDCPPLPALGGQPYTPLPYTPGVWYADPLLFVREGRRWLFAEAFDMAAERGEIVVFELLPDGTLTPPQPVLKEDYHLSFPNVFEWRGETWMIPETGTNHSLNLYRCVEFPAKWECAHSFAMERELADTLILKKTEDALTLLCSEVHPENGLLVRYRRYTLAVNAAPEYTITPDETYNLQNREFDLTSRNAGPYFTHCGQPVHPTQVSTTVDYGVYLQFMVRRGCGEVPLCAATPDNVTITGLANKDIIGIHTYCCDDEFEIIDARYLRKVEKLPAEKTPTEKADIEKTTTEKADAEKAEAEKVEAEKISAEQAPQA